MDVLVTYPYLALELNKLCQTRRNEILQEMVEKDNVYNALRHARTDASMHLRDALHNKYKLLDDYSNKVFAQECYELDALYRQGFLDALKVLVERGEL